LNFCSVQTEFGIAPPGPVLPGPACQHPAASLPRSPLSLPHPAADTGPATRPAPPHCLALLSPSCTPSLTLGPRHARRLRHARFFASRCRLTRLGHSLSPISHLPCDTGPRPPHSLSSPSRFVSRSRRAPLLPLPHARSPLLAKALQFASSPPTSRFTRSRAPRSQLHAGFLATAADVRLLGREPHSLGPFSD
jgi:hypothetical protein